MKWSIPNTLTVLRLLAAPGVPLMFLYFQRPWADWFALTLFVGAAITDWFDGYLARLWKQESKFGTMLDPIADKAMVVIAILVLTGYSGMNPWLILPATVILFREVFVSGLREFLGAKAGLAESHEVGKVEDHGANGGDCGAVFGHRVGISQRCGDARHDARAIYRRRHPRAGRPDPRLRQARLRFCGG